jgi:hypothetical protein
MLETPLGIGGLALSVEGHVRILKSNENPDGWVGVDDGEQLGPIRGRPPPFDFDVVVVDGEVRGVSLGLCVGQLHSFIKGGDALLLQGFPYRFLYA